MHKNIPNANSFSFHGVKLEDITELELCFNVKVMVYCLNSNGTVSLIYNSLNNNTDVMYLNMYDNHFSYITNFEKLVKKFQCDKCLKLFKRQWNLRRHYTNCYDRTKYSFPGGFFCNSTTLFDKLKSLNIHVPLEFQFYNKFIVWDMEAILLKSNLSKSDKLTWISQHHPISVSIASNVENFEESECFVNTDPDQLINQMMSYISEISLYNKELMSEKYDEVYVQLNELISRYSGNSSLTEFSKSNHDKKIESHFFKSLTNIKKELDRYISQIPVIGFNSGKYDLNLIKKYIMSYIVENYTEQDIHTIKKENSYLSISTPDIKFIDISNYLASGCSYSQFLKAYGCDEPKGIFPYEWFDSFEKLNYPQLPQPEDFYSKIKKDNPIKNEGDYRKLQGIWEDEGMTTFEDYLIYYNNLDTGPFVIALNNLLKVYFDEGIDIFKDYVTLPGVARRMLYNSSNSKFSLFNYENDHLYYTFKQNIVGGPSIIFSRYQEKGVTDIKGIFNNKCQSVVGYDCNGLYSYAIRQEMPTGLYVIRPQENNFRPEVSEKYIDSYVWLDYISKTENVKILHKLNNGKEIRFGNYLVDGYCVSTKTVYEYNGCYYHNCPFNCFIVKRIKSKKWLKKIQETQIKDDIKKKFLLGQGLKYVSIQECEYNEKVKPKSLSLYNNYLPSYYQNNKSTLSQNKIIDDISKGLLFGAVEVDIAINDNLFEYFKEYPPFFCTCDVPMNAIGEHMTEFCNDNDINFKNGKLLISGTKAKKILLATPLLKWYLMHNCKITKIYQVIEFQPKKSFTSFIETVTENRIIGDKHKDKSIIGDTYKLLSNSAYGSVLINKTKHCNIKYLDNKGKVVKMINSKNFKSLDTINDTTYEVEMYKNQIKMDNFILQYAKLRMLEFYYDCLVTYMKPNSFEITETDTDRIYMALNEDSLHKCIKEEYYETYYKEIYNQCKDNDQAKWFPRKCCDKHIAIDKRFTGIFKEEFLGDKMISLCSKSYIIQNKQGKQKISCKGISKKHLSDPMSSFENTLKNRTINSAKNMGFRLKNNNIFTYSQEKIGFNYFYCKRKVLGDGISTVPLDIELCPWSNNVELIEKVQDPLSNLYPCKLLHNNIFFPSSEHLFLYHLCLHFNYQNTASELLKILDPTDLHKFISDKAIDLNKDYAVIERLMRFSILLKLNQCPLFYNKLSKMEGTLIYYKQVNLKKDLAGFLGVITKSSLVSITIR